MRAVKIVFVLGLLINACRPPVSTNTYKGTSEDYACALPTGEIELRSMTAPFPDCSKLSDLPKEDADAIVTAAEKQNSTILRPGTVLINTNL